MKRVGWAALCAAGVMACAGQAAAAVINYDLIGTITSGGGDPQGRFTVGGTVDFNLSWDDATSTELGGTGYRIAETDIQVSANGVAFWIGSDINDGSPVYTIDTFDAGHDTYTYFAAPLVIYDSTGVLGLMVYTDGGYGPDNPGFKTSSFAYGDQSCVRELGETSFTCVERGTFVPGNTAQFFGGLYHNTYQGGYNLTLAYGAFSVPEPATWAMMLGGLGFIGAALRRRRLAIA